MYMYFQFTNVNKNQNAGKKTWTSLPTGDIPPGLLRNGSVGSLDNHLQSMVSYIYISI